MASIPVMMGTSAISPYEGRCMGGILIIEPSSRGKNCIIPPGTAFAASIKVFACTVRRHARVSCSFEHPTLSRMKSYVPWISVISLVGTAKPELMMPARNKPWVSPSLAYRCRNTEMDPALSPQLPVVYQCHTHLHYTNVILTWSPWWDRRRRQR